MIDDLGDVIGFVGDAVEFVGEAADLFETPGKRRRRRLRRLMPWLLGAALLSGLVWFLVSL